MPHGKSARRLQVTKNLSTLTSELATTRGYRRYACAHAQRHEIPASAGEAAAGRSALLWNRARGTPREKAPLDCGFPQN
jgi:hypothetical protein